MESIQVPKCKDMHYHFRSGDMLRYTVPWVMAYATEAVAMPNIAERPIRTGADVQWHRGEILAAAERYGPRGRPFTPLMTIKLDDDTTPADIESAKQADAVALKIYPQGITSHSDKGITDFTAPSFLDNLRAARDCGLIVLLHAEIRLAGQRRYYLDKERDAHAVLRSMIEAVPDGRYVAEHISRAETVSLVQELWPTLSATITAHHLCTTTNDILDDGIQPDYGCNPMPGDFTDLDALLGAATSGLPCFLFGSDAAVHLEEKKYCKRGACGCNTAPIMAPLLATIFDRAGALDKLAQFTSTFAEQRYGLQPTTETLTLVRQPMTVPDRIGPTIPFLAGQTLPWSLQAS